MRKGKLVLGGCLGGCGLAAALLLFAFYQQTPVTKIALQGTPGLRFEGHIKADGRVMNISGAIPSEFIIPGRNIECSFSKQHSTGRMALQIFGEDQKSFQETFTEQSKGGVQGNVHISQGMLGSMANYLKRESTVTIFEK